MSLTTDLKQQAACTATVSLLQVDLDFLFLSDFSSVRWLIVVMLLIGWPQHQSRLQRHIPIRLKNVPETITQTTRQYTAVCVCVRVQVHFSLCVCAFSFFPAGSEINLSSTKENNYHSCTRKEGGALIQVRDRQKNREAARAADGPPTAISLNRVVGFYGPALAERRLTFPA